MQILKLMQTPSNIINLSYNYIFVIFLGIPVSILYNLCAGVLRSLGDSKTPVYFLIISAILNVVLDIVFMVFLKFGVSGAALATVISQGTSGFLSLIYISKKFDILKIQKDEWAPRKEYIKKLLYIGIPMGLQYSITAIGSVIITAAVNSLGSVYIAAVTAGNRISMLFYAIFDALGSTIATFTGQNVGAKNIKRVREGIRFAIFVSIIYSIISFLVMFFFGGTISQIFLSSDSSLNSSQIPEIINYSAMFLVVNSLFYIPLAFVNIFRFGIQGMGFSNIAMFAGVFEMIARGFAGLFLVPYIGYWAICIASPLAWILADSFLIPTFFACARKLEKRQSIEV